ncbi:hypothetical protein J5N97_001625 [Dioscorea zingiberensis]|uniref:TMS membrane family protein n=1 Tax=Dioscorea zingiberensis TaxID=325984 RepID=A0A9D5BTW7_9LILI|nr:hypothetical protein J5N97_001625 [Dioscorea zingiberensis]
MALRVVVCQDHTMDRSAGDSLLGSLSIYSAVREDSAFWSWSFVMAVLVIVMATFSTGLDSNCFQFKKTEPESADDVPYGYGFFHFVFAMGTMYFAMLFIGWNPHKTMKKWTIDVGWASTWVRIVNEWLATLVYSNVDAGSALDLEEQKKSRIRIT